MNPLKNILNQLDLIENKAVFFRDKEEGGIFNSFSSDVNKKLEDIKPDAFYVFNNQPFVLFFDLTSNSDINRESEIHKKVWSFDNSPIIFVINDTEVKVYNALNFEKHKGLEEIELSEKERNKRFSFWNLQSGEAFEWFYEKHKKTVLKKRVNQQLFENIKQTILILKNDFGLEESLAKILVLRLIFIRYLIDRKIKIDTSFIVGNEEDIIQRRRSLSELIANPKQLVVFFDYLNKRFNGVLFKDSNIELSLNQANLLSKLFNPDGVSTEDKINLFSDFDFQYDVFDFGIIPVELISGIYETLLDEETKNATSAVYTPPFLVDYILTETVDKFFEENKSISECKIFDPAMGSGIFLVQGLRRMIEREKELNPNDDNLTFGTKIRTIAEKNLFGIDINEEAINVACFSIYVALLDYQEPGNIDIYKFPNLKDKNFFKSNFFVREVKENDSEVAKKELEIFSSSLEVIKSQKMNFILGNPPWKRDKSDYHIGWLNENNIYLKQEKGEKEIALSYLMRANDFMTKDTVCSLIVTSTIFYNVSDTIRYVKSNFFKNNSIQSILDLSAVRRLVFDGEKRVPRKDRNKNLILDKNGNILYKNQKIISPALNIQFKQFDKEYSENNPIHFKSIKANKFFNKFTKALVIEKFDYKKILQKHFIENHWMFKVALYGNTLDYLLLKKLEKSKNKIINLFDGSEIFKGAGIKSNKGNDFADFLIGLPLIENGDINLITTNINDNNLILKAQDVYYESGRIKELFFGSKILIKEQAKDESKLAVSYIEENCAYKNGIWGICSENRELIKSLFSYLLSDIYTYYIYLISGSWGTSTRPQIRLDDEYLSFPFIEPNEIQKDRMISLVENLLKPYKEFYKEHPNSVFQGEPSKEILDEINSIVEEIYQITGYEKDLIDYVLNVSRYQFQESKQRLVSDFNNDDHRNREKVLRSYADVYIEEFEKIYDDEFIQIEIYSLDYFIAMNFVFLSEKPSKKIVYSDKKDEKQVLNNLANSLSISQITNANDSENNLFIQKDIKGFEKDSFYIIKPNEYKCWHRAMAWYDVAEFKEAIQKAELERLNSDFHA
ncbi:Eco57I restriction-modification methylase domain-containing protein [Flavobacterium undicola]|uniref:Eco57I restriction-modification methylase domain-containing protein n=1 Tax=Flavobacterium undicola TaxID=1932779 RepID=UPI001376EE97|nr:DNA methyltransferase [Flavobacterium undicola]MBA0884593.1 hypothetical protein [Flavobacterium undicola]